MGFSSEQVHCGFSGTEKMTVEHPWGERVYTQLYSHGGRSITRISSTQRVGLSTTHSCLSLCPRCCNHSSLCSPAAMQLTALGGVLYIVSNNVLPTRVQGASQPGSGENPGHRNLHFLYKLPPCHPGRQPWLGPMSPHCGSYPTTPGGQPWSGPVPPK